MTGTLIGHRSDGRPIHLLRGAADDDTPDAPPPPPAPPAAPPAAKDDAEALRAERDAARAEAAQHAERLRALMAGNAAPAAGGDDEDDEDDEQSSRDGKPVDAQTLKLQRAVRAANRESKARREQIEKVRAELQAEAQRREAEAERASRELAEQRRIAEAETKARQEAEARYRPATIKLAALPAFLAAGAKPERADKLIRLLDMDALDVDPAGEVTGLTEQIDAVKADYPELFATADPAPPKPALPRVTGADRPPADQTPTRSADILARSVLGRPA